MSQRQRHVLFVLGRLHNSTVIRAGTPDAPTTTTFVGFSMQHASVIKFGTPDAPSDEQHLTTVTICSPETTHALDFGAAGVQHIIQQILHSFDFGIL
jgi:hypothetical protein